MSRRDDVDELVSELADLRYQHDEQGSPVGTRRLVDALDTARNCIENLARELEQIESRIERLERGWRESR